ncbi:MAG: hypothetical protein ACK5RG_10095 [Cyclobacteriaceae bacterium]|jgi:Leucine-rich repeat (LRR) protein|nr:hypothetical protein [Flammeovirgaceae bacterium]
MKALFTLILTCFVFVISSNKIVFAQTECKATEVFEVGDTATYKSRLMPILKCEALKNLTIQITQNKGWVVFSSVQGNDFGFRYSAKLNLVALLEDLGIAKNLESLEVSDLGIDYLPESMVDLVNLQSLDIGFNKLNVSKELPKINSLSNLKVLKIYGCIFTEDDLETIRKQLPNVTILYSQNHLIEEFKARNKK